MGFFKEIFSRNEMPSETQEPNKRLVEAQKVNKSLVEPQNTGKVKTSSEEQVIFFEHQNEFEKNLSKTSPTTPVSQQTPVAGTQTNSTPNIPDSKNPPNNLGANPNGVVPFTQSPIGSKTPVSSKPTSKPIDGRDFDFTGKPKNFDSKLVEPQRPATTYWPKRYSYASLIILVVENSNAVAKYRTEVMNILKKISKDNNNALFLLVRTGYLEKEFDIMTFEQLDSSKSIDSLVFMSSFEDTGVHLHNSLECVLNKVYDINKNAKIIKFELQPKDSDATKDSKTPDALTSTTAVQTAQKEVPKTSKEPLPQEFIFSFEEEEERGFFKSKSKSKDKDKFKPKDDRIEYRISEMNAVFIGTGAHTDLDKARKALNSLLATNSIKSIKYFCVKDTDTINAALLGFPLIGHIESNFYK